MAIKVPDTHFCILHHSEAQLAKFLKRGLQRNQQVLVLDSNQTNESILARLRTMGVCVEDFVARGQLLCYHAATFLLDDRSFDQDKLQDFFCNAVNEALKKGFVAVRVAVGMSWTSEIQPPDESLSWKVEMGLYQLPKNLKISVALYKPNVSDNSLAILRLLEVQSRLIKNRKGKDQAGRSTGRDRNSLQVARDGGVDSRLEFFRIPRPSSAGPDAAAAVVNHMMRNIVDYNKELARERRAERQERERRDQQGTATGKEEEEEEEKKEEEKESDVVKAAYAGKDISG